MENLSLSCDLLKLSGAFVANVNGKRSVVLPIDENDLYEFTRSKDSSRGVVLRLNAWKLKEVSQYGDTHMIRQDMSKQWQEKHQDGNTLPILGNGREYAYRDSRPEVESITVTPITDAPQPQVADTEQPDNGNDLPF